jgi:hypothetical protein
VGKVSFCYMLMLKCCRPGNWLVRQLNDEPKQVHKVGFIREKGKATTRDVKWSREAGNSLHR